LATKFKIPTAKFQFDERGGDESDDFPRFSLVENTDDWIKSSIKFFILQLKFYS